MIFNKNDLSPTVPGKQWKKNMPRLGVLNVFDWARWLCYRAFDAIYHFLCELIFKSIKFAFCAYRTMWIWKLMNRPLKNSPPTCKYFDGFLEHNGLRWNIMWNRIENIKKRPRVQWTLVDVFLIGNYTVIAFICINCAQCDNEGRRNRDSH